MITEKDLYEILKRKEEQYKDSNVHRDNPSYKSGYDNAIELMVGYTKLNISQSDFLESVDKTFHVHANLWMEYGRERYRSKRTMQSYLIEDGYTDALWYIIEHFVYDM